MFEPAVQPLRQILADFRQRPPDGAAKAFRPRSAVTFYHDPLQTEKTGAIVLGRAQIVAQTTQQRQRQPQRRAPQQPAS